MAHRSQCFTVFMRPFYFHDLSLLMSDRVPDTQSTNLGEDFSDCVQAMKMDCLHAAQNNCKILLDLARHGKIGQLTRHLSYSFQCRIRGSTQNSLESVADTLSSKIWVLGRNPHLLGSGHPLTLQASRSGHRTGGGRR